MACGSAEGDLSARKKKERVTQAGCLFVVDKVAVPSLLRNCFKFAPNLLSRRWRF